MRFINSQAILILSEIGADISENKLVLQKGLRLGPPELGILASVGAHKVSVFKYDSNFILQEKHFF